MHDEWQSGERTKVVLESAAQEFAEGAANPPYLFDLGPVEGRKVVDDVQAGEIAKPDVDIDDTTVDDVPVRILKRGRTSGRSAQVDGPPFGSL